MKLSTLNTVLRLAEKRRAMREAAQALSHNAYVCGPLGSAIPNALGDPLGRKAIRDTLLAEAQRRLDGYEHELRELGVEIDDDG